MTYAICVNRYIMGMSAMAVNHNSEALITAARRGAAREQSAAKNTDRSNRGKNFPTILISGLSRRGENLAALGTEPSPRRYKRGLHIHGSRQRGILIPARSPAALPELTFLTRSFAPLLATSSFVNCGYA